MTREGIEVFISYSHSDERLRVELGKHLSQLEKDAIVSVWHDRKITPGGEWKLEIDSRLENASIIILLISPDFLDSGYCYNVEMKRAMEKHDAGNACVIPVILRAVDWQSAPFAKLQALPAEGRPVTSWANQDEAFRDVAIAVRGVARKFRPMHNSADPETKSMTFAKITFKNRDRELEILLNSLTIPASKHFWLIIAGPQMGKTWLLEELQKKLPKHNPEQWVITQADLRKESQEIRIEAKRLVARLFGEWVLIGDIEENLFRIAEKIRESKLAWLCLLDSAEIL